MSKRILTRMGDGERVWMSEAEIRSDIQEGTEDAARRAEIPPLTQEEQDRIFDIMADPARIVGVNPGEEVVVTDDGCSMSFYSGQDSGGVGVPLSRMQAVLTYERACGADTTSLGHSDYSYKPVKPIINTEMHEYYNISMQTTAPFFYGAQPNMGLYFQPDGPCPNPSELLSAGNIEAALEAQEAAAAHLKKDLVYVGRKMAEVGCEGLNFDTSGSAGDADFMAALQGVSALKERVPDLPILLGASGEFVIGMHGGVQFAGKRLAGLYPHHQVKVAEAAGADIFGLAIGTNTKQSVAWNLSRTVTFLKETIAAAHIPVHANVGMGVCGIPMMELPPIDSVTRVSKTLVQIGKADGLQIGVGDPLGMHSAHIMASCMGGIRTSGDLVAWMQMTRRMKIHEAKAYVAQKLGVDVRELTDEEIMRSVRMDLGLGTATSIAGSPKGIRAKMKIAELLEITIRSVELFKSQI